MASTTAAAGEADDDDHHHQLDQGEALPRGRLRSVPAPSPHATLKARLQPSCVGHRQRRRPARADRSRPSSRSASASASASSRSAISGDAQRRRAGGVDQQAGEAAAGAGSGPRETLIVCVFSKGTIHSRRFSRPPVTNRARSPSAWPCLRQRSTAHERRAAAEGAAPIPARGSTSKAPTAATATPSEQPGRRPAQQRAARDAHGTRRAAAASGKPASARIGSNLLHPRERRGDLDAAFLLVGAERLEGKPVPAEPARDRAALDQRDLGAADRDHHFRQGEQPAPAPQPGLASGSAGSRNRAPPSAPRRRPRRAGSAAAARISAMLQRQIAGGRLGALGGEPVLPCRPGRTGRAAAARATIAARKTQREAEQAGKKQPRQVHREQHRLRRRVAAAVAARGRRRGGCGRAARGRRRARSCRDCPRPCGRAAGLDPDLGGAEQAGEQPLLDGDVLDAVERDDPALALKQPFSITISPAPIV